MAVARASPFVASLLALLLLPAQAWAGGAYLVLPPGVPPPPVPPLPVLLVGPEAAGQEIGCSNRDVVVRADGISVTLRGGCRSLRVEGGRVTVTAELLPGAVLRIGSAGVVVNYALVGFGPPPVVRLTRPGLHASHLERLGQTALSLPIPAAIDTTASR